MLEITEVEGGDEVDANPKIAVCVGESPSSSYALKYALQKLVSPGQTLHLLHVRPPLRFISTPMGNKLPVEQVSENVVKKVNDEREMETRKLLAQYLKMCTNRHVKSDVHILDNCSIRKELVCQIFRLGIANLVLGTSTHGKMARAFRGESISSNLIKHAPDFCTVVVVHKDKVSVTKDATSALIFQGSPLSSCSTPPEFSFSGVETIEGDFISSGSIHIENPCYSLSKSVGISPRTTLSESASTNSQALVPEWLLKRGKSYSVLQGRRVQMQKGCQAEIEEENEYHRQAQTYMRFSMSDPVISFESASVGHMNSLSYPSLDNFNITESAEDQRDISSEVPHVESGSDNQTEGYYKGPIPPLLINQGDSNISTTLIEGHISHDMNHDASPASILINQGELGIPTVLINNRVSCDIDPDASIASMSANLGDLGMSSLSINNHMPSHLNKYASSQYLDASDTMEIPSDVGVSNHAPTLEGKHFQKKNSSFFDAELPSTRQTLGVEGFDSDDLEVLKSQLDTALRESELQQDRCKQAMRMVEEYEAQRNLEIQRNYESLKEVKVAKKQVLREARRCAELEDKLQMALAEKEILIQSSVDCSRKQQELQCELDTLTGLLEASRKEIEDLRQQVNIESRKFNVSHAELQEAILEIEQLSLRLEETKEALQSEMSLRKDVEEKLLQESIAKQEALTALRKAHQRYTEYTFNELQIATSNFHEQNKLGEGGYGPVYKGILHHTPVAIKILAKEGSQGLAEFQREVELLSRIHHPHMVILLGACPERSCIVYEYMANGSLEDRLNCKNGTPPLPWFIRFRICFEVATALLFLHSRPQPIVHRDLKPGNILLDHNFVSKIGDVGIATLVPNNLTFNGPTAYRETVPVGTFAYIDPDYHRTGVLSCESDVYALGMVMFQLLTGKPAVGVADLVEEAVDNGHLENVLDKSAGDWPFAEAMGLACLSLQCTEPRRRHRPDLEHKVLGTLENIRAVADAAATNMACAGPSNFGGDHLIPSIFICPISQEIMLDPHIAADGYTYEKEAIESWLVSHDTSPMTNKFLNHKNLIPNYSLRSAIKEWQERGQVST